MINDELVRKGWEHYRALASAPFVVSPSIPILYFGNSERYFGSPHKIITVGLNPSRIEFPDEDRFARFPLAVGLAPDAGTSELRCRLVASLDNYFKVRPYRRWFDQSFEPVLRGLDCSYYEGRENVALHTDLCSPLATNPTWSRLGHARSGLESFGHDFWHALVDELQPDLMIFSIAWSYLHRIGLPTIHDWTCVYSIDRARPYRVHAKTVRLPSGKRSTMAFGRAANLPFGTISHADKTRVGVALKELLYA